MPDLPFAVTLNRAGPSPIHLQLAAQLREAALAGQLLPGSLLPGTRTLARDLGVTRGVVEAAYALLSADGTLQGEVGRGTRVSRGGGRTAEAAASALLPADGTPRAEVGRAPRVSGGVGPTARAAAPSPAWFAPRVPSPGMHSDERPGLHFRPGVTSAAMLHAQAWKRAWACAARQPVGGGYADAAGLPELRAAVSAFVGRSRGLAATPDTLLLTAGTLQSLGLLARAVLPAGATVLFENPGYRAGRAVLEGAGLRLVPLPVDEDGPVVDNLPPAHAVYVTPSHQFPLGSRPSLPRPPPPPAWTRRGGRGTSAPFPRF
jgi:Transcriptional regulators containing a DNA-binding HTH domain and an aminotransferase domain (MocR family) and their eukaryotic orthologs